MKNIIKFQCTAKRSVNKPFKEIRERELQGFSSDVKAWVGGIFHIKL